MIKRKYFIMMKKIHADGTPGYSSHSTIHVHRSWFPDVHQAFDNAVRDIKLAMMNAPGDVFVIEAFNRV